jgi:hypothetical protein
MAPNTGELFPVPVEAANASVASVPVAAAGVGLSFLDSSLLVPASWEASAVSELAELLLLLLGLSDQLFFRLTKYKVRFLLLGSVSLSSSRPCRSRTFVCLTVAIMRVAIGILRVLV